MEFAFDLSYFADFLEYPFIFLDLVGFIFLKTWWLFVLAIIFYLTYFFWMNHVWNKYLSSIEYVLLEISIPPLAIERGPKITEQIFASLRGIMGEANFIDKYFKGKIQDSFSFEILGTGSAIHFLIRTPARYRDVVEAAVYAQYPEAVIQEVEDYTVSVPDEFPDEEWDLWGTELKLTKSDIYPIRTYKYFIDDYTKEFVDPMAAIVEFLGKLLPGEQIWFQFIITPIRGDWRERGIKEVKKLIGEAVPKKETIGEKIVFTPLRTIDKQIVDAFFSLAPSEKKSEKDLVNKMQYLSPGEEIAVEAIEKKIAKIGYLVKSRFIYLGKKEVFSKAKGVVGGMGVINQFTDQMLNGLRPNSGTMTSTPLFFGKRRLAKKQTKILRAYKSRSRFTGGKEFILNIEELATLYHFPTISVKAPLLTRIQPKTGEPPSILPVQEVSSPLSAVRATRALGKPPENLPVEE